MVLKTKFHASVCLGFIGVVAGWTSAMSMVAVSVDVGCRSGSCAQRMRCQIEQCNDLYDAENPNSGNPYNTYDNQVAYDACLAAAGNERSACDDLSGGGGDPDILYALWVEFRNEMIACFDDFGPDGRNPNNTLLETCIASTLDGYRHALGQLLNPPTDGCAGGAFPFPTGGLAYAGPMAAIQAAAIEAGQTNGKYQTPVNTSLSFSAGFNMNPDSAYDVKNMPCVKQALLMIVYNTADGVVVENMDADTDTSDGTNFDVHLFANKLKDTQDVYLVTIFFDDFDVPQFAELGVLELQDSPIQGDWNRDEVLNTQDVIDYLSSYSAQTKRADITQDGLVDSDDATAFTQEYTD